MKKLLLACLLMFVGISTNQAQDVFHAVLMGAQEVIDHQSADDMQLKIAQFKVTALGYMHRKMIERNPDTPARILDVQAYYMSEFLSRFFADVREHKDASEKERKEAILVFINATVCNPMFNDPDRKTVEIYIKDGDNMTPFSIDTDWQKAYEAIK